jgi:hypothetical protein
MAKDSDFDYDGVRDKNDPKAKAQAIKHKQEHLYCLADERKTVRINLILI